MTARALTVMTGLAVLVAALAGGIGWITHHVHQEVVWRVGSGVAAVLMVFWFMLFFSTPRDGQQLRLAEYEVRRRASGATRRRLKIYPTGRYAMYGLVSALMFTSVTVFMLGNSNYYAGGYLFAVVALLPVACELAIRDMQTRTRCPDCREDIRTDANVCKHCGFRLGPKPHTPRAPTLESVESDQRAPTVVRTREPDDQSPVADV